MKYQDNNALLIDYVNYSEMILKLCQLTDQVDMKNYLLEVRKYYMTIQQNINESDCFLALPNLKKILSLNKLEYQTLIFVTSMELSGYLRSLYQSLFQTGYLYYSSVFTLLKHIVKITYQEFMISLHQNKNYALLMRDDGTKPYYHMERYILLQDYVAAYIFDGQIFEMPGAQIIVTSDIYYLPLHQDIYTKLTFKPFQLWGRSGSGKHSLCYRYLQAHAYQCLLVDATLLDSIDLYDYSKYIIFQYQVFHFIPCFDHISEASLLKLKVLLAMISYTDIPYILISEDYIHILENCHHIPDFLSQEEKQMIIDKYPYLHDVKRELAVYHLNIADMIYFIKLNTSLTHQDIISYFYKQPIEQKYCTMVESHLNMTYWIGDESIQDKLNYFLYLIQYQNEVKSDFQNKGHFLQKSVSALFHGKSGTGKTYAAKAIAGELGRRLLVANLSKINDKYIGETEKHLDDIFYIAARYNCILFFDEADVLFTKRTEVQQANDKYANVSTAYLLQKIENFDGIIILATNLIHNFDDAFLRRLSMIIKFEESTEETRYLMFKELCSQMNHDLDYTMLARVYPFSLARIEQIVMTAYLMARQSKQILNMEMMKKAMQWELAKQGEIFVEK